MDASISVNSEATLSSDEARQTKWTPENVQKRLEARSRRQARYDDLLEQLKQRGNNHYKNGEYEDAPAIYASIVVGYGFKAVAISNYVATMLKTGFYAKAETMATEGLKLDPKNLKLRFRRAMARKALQRYNAALIDLETVLLVDPACEEARQQRQILATLLQRTNRGHEDPPPDESMSVADPAFPPVDKPGFPDEEVESDSEDFVHTGNGLACKRYNRGTCTEQTQCAYSHAPDWKSQRDKLGRNVCNCFLLRQCPLSADECLYVHDKSYLPDGWWNDERALGHGAILFGNGNLQPHDFEEALTPTLATYGRPREYPRYRKLSRQDPFSRQNGSTDEQFTAADRMLQPRTGFVMVLGLYMDLDFSFKRHTLNAIHDVIEVKFASSAREALAHLSSPDLKGVFAADSGIHKRKNAKVLERLVEYPKSGGRVVLGGSFSGEISPVAMDKLFEENWGLPWKFGDYFRTTFTTNYANMLTRANDNLSESYSMKAVHLKDVPITQAVYYAAEGARTQSHVFPSVPVPNPSETPVAFTKIGDGYIGYVGDVNWEVGSARVVLAMLDVLQAPPRPVVRPFVVPNVEQMAFTFNGEYFIDDYSGGGEEGENGEQWDEDEEEEDDSEDDEGW